MTTSYLLLGLLGGVSAVAACMLGGRRDRPALVRVRRGRRGPERR